MKAIVGKITDEVRQQAKSGTMKAMTVCLFIESLAVSLTYLEPFFTEDEFGKISAVMAFATSMIAMMFRQVTDTAISDK